MFFVEPYGVLLVLLELKSVLWLSRIVDRLRGRIVDDFDIGTADVEIAFESDFLYV